MTWIALVLSCPFGTYRIMSFCSYELLSLLHDSGHITWFRSCYIKRRHWPFLRYVNLCASSAVCWHIAHSILVSVYSGAENGSMAGYSEAIVRSSSNLEVSLFVMVCHNCAMEFAQEFVFGQHTIHFFLEHNMYWSTYGLFYPIFFLCVINFLFFFFKPCLP